MYLPPHFERQGEQHERQPDGRDLLLEEADLWRFSDERRIRAHHEPQRGGQRQSAAGSHEEQGLYVAQLLAPALRIERDSPRGEPIRAHPSQRVNG